MQKSMDELALKETWQNSQFSRELKRGEKKAKTAALYKLYAQCD